MAHVGVQLAAPRVMRCWILIASLLAPSCSAPTANDPGEGLQGGGKADGDGSSASTAGLLSFTFDDCYLSQLTQAAPILAAHDFTATEYAAILRMTEEPDIGNAPFMTWDGLHALRDQFHWDIASHTMTHPLLTTVTPDQLDTELVQAQQTLAANGFVVTGFATPYGDYNDDVLRRAATVYRYHRPFHDIDILNSFPVDRSLLWVKQVQVGGGPDNIPSVGVPQVEAWIDQAIAHNAWLVLVFHDIEDRTVEDLSTNNVAWGYAFNASDFAAIADYSVAKGIAVRTPEQVLAPTAAPNLIANGGFMQGLAGFTTDQPTRVIIDQQDNGDLPTPTDSVALHGAADGAHLFGPKVSVMPGSSYTIETYLNATQLTSGSVGFYVDEWDDAGTWVSGQYIRDDPTDPRRRVEHVAFNYVPGAGASTASLQIILSPGASGVAFVDEVSWFAGRLAY